MKCIFQSLAAVAVVLLVACNNKEKQAETTTDSSTGTTSTDDSKNKEVGNKPASFEVVISPDSALLGKTSEAFIKVLGGTAVALSDPDGKDNGSELVIQLQATNRGKIGEGGGLSVSYADSRLVLDNGNNISAETGTSYLRAEPEASSPVEKWTYKIPAGAKPTALNLFLDGTRASVKVSYK